MRKHARIGPDRQEHAMTQHATGSGPCHVNACLELLFKGIAEDGGNPPGEPLRDGSISQGGAARRSGGRKPAEADRLAGDRPGLSGRGKVFACDNGSNARGRRGVMQRVVLNQKSAQPVVASAWSKAEGVTGIDRCRVRIYLDLVFTDGTELWAQVAGFRTGTHDWQREEVIVYPEKPIKSLDFNLLLRDHAGKAWFRDRRSVRSRPRRAASCSMACPWPPPARRSRGSRLAIWGPAATSCGSQRKPSVCDWRSARNSKRVQRSLTSWFATQPARIGR